MAVYLAVCFQLKTTLHTLLSRGCSPNVVVQWGDHYSPLHAAISLEDEDMCSDLVHAGAALNIQDRWGLTPLHLAVHLESRHASRFVDLLCKAGADCTISDQDGDTALKIAAGYSEVEAIGLLLSMEVM